MDELNRDTVFAFDPDAMTITRKATSIYTYRRITLGRGTTHILKTIREGIRRQIAANPRDTEFLIVVWQDVLYTYFSHWEE